MKAYTMSKLVKSEDLNHHGTLFAGRMAEWFIEGAFIAAASTYKNPDNMVCLKMHGLKFTTPVKKGEIITLETKVIYTGNTSMTVYGKVTKNSDIEKIIVDGFTTFICVDENGKKMPHNIVLEEPENEEEAKLREYAKSLR